MIAETGLPDIVFVVPEQSQKAAREVMRFARADPRGSHGRSYLAAYVGIYSIIDNHSGHGLLALAIDHDPEDNVLFVRGALREWRGGDDFIPEYLEGFAVPEPGQLILMLRHGGKRASYSIRVPTPHETFALPAVSRSPWTAAWVVNFSAQIPVRPAIEPPTEPHVPRYGLDELDTTDDIKEFRRWPASRIDYLDIFRDNMDIRVPYSHFDYQMNDYMAGHWWRQMPRDDDE